VNRYRREAERHYQVLNEHLEGRTYIVGETYTIADISAWGWLDRASRVRKGAEDPLESFPDLKATVLGFGARRDSMKVFERNDGDARRMGRPSPEKARTRPLPSDMRLIPRW
jgi:GST-like protein